MKRIAIFTLSLLMLCSLIALGACSKPEEETKVPTITAQQSSYPVGTAEIVVEIKNPTDAAISYSSAYWIEEAHGAGVHGDEAHGHKLEWKPFSNPASGTETIEPGASATVTVKITGLEETLEAGSYQVGFDIGDEPSYAAFTLA